MNFFQKISKNLSLLSSEEYILLIAGAKVVLIFYYASILLKIFWNLYYFLITSFYTYIYIYNNREHYLLRVDAF